MERAVRIWAKAVSWQVLGLLSMTVIGYAFTGSVSAGGAMALTTSAIAIVAYVAHESLWRRVRWGLDGQPPTGGRRT